MAMKPFIHRFKKLFGPGVITGIADDDPSGIATYAQTGAMFGLGQLWLVLFSYPFMVTMQEMCGRIGLITGRGLSSIIKHYYSKKILYGAIALLALANIINIGADLGAMSEAIQLILPFPFIPTLVVLTLITVLAEVLVPYKVYVSFLKYMALTVFAYVLGAFALNQDWSTVITHAVTPHIEWNTTFILNITAMLGTTISPYLFFWQTSEETEEEVVAHKLKALDQGKPLLAKMDLHNMRKDTAFGMFISNVVTFFIIITASSTLGANGMGQIGSAAELASALEPFAGSFASILFVFAIVGTGLLAVPVLAGSLAYAVAEAFDWNEGLGKAFFQAKAFYGVIIVATLVGVLINLSRIEPISMLYYSAILNGLLAPPLMLLILLISNNKKILGDKTNGIISNTLGISITIIMFILTIHFLYTLF
jgi:NRAMP (natural resistance-associated macrophage protein)-like metal ion transporter